MLMEGDVPVGPDLPGHDPQRGAGTFERPLGDLVTVARLLLDVLCRPWPGGERRPQERLGARLRVSLLTVLGAEDVPDAALGLTVEDEPADAGVTFPGRHRSLMIR